MSDLLELPGRPPIEESGSSRWATGCGAPGRLLPSVLFRSRYCSAACATARILGQTPVRGFIRQSLNQADGGIRRRAAGRSPPGLPGEINVARFVVRPIQQLSPLRATNGFQAPALFVATIVVRPMQQLFPLTAASPCRHRSPSSSEAPSAAPSDGSEPPPAAEGLLNQARGNAPIHSLDGRGNWASWSRGCGVLMMGVRDIERSLEQWQLGVKDLRRRIILAPTPREWARWCAIRLLSQGWGASAPIGEGGPAALIFEPTGGFPPPLTRRSKRS